MKLPLFPLRGFINAVLRQDVPLNALTGLSLDWLVGRNRYRRRAGTSLVTNGILESKWSAKARRMIAAALPSVSDSYPTPLILYTDETSKSATIAWQDGQGGSWRQVGDDFSATSYPDTGVPTHRVVPMVYENEYGGITLHRLNTAEYRQHMAAGSRDIQQSGKNVCWPGYNSAPTRWKDTGSANEVYPLGMIPPLTMPVCTAGTDIVAAPGPWLGSNAFFFSVLFENEQGELSMFTIPRPPGSAWAGFQGLGYMHIDNNNPTHYFDSVVYSNIPDGPPGTRWKHLLRSTKVDIATTGAGAIVQPAIADMNFFARIPQGQTSYTDAEGNDLVLDNDPRVQDLWQDAGLMWAPRARSMGRFDGHATLGNLRLNPYALIVAPWNNGDQNLQAENASLYGATSFFVSIQPTNMILRSVLAGVATDRTIDISGDLTIRQLSDAIGNDAGLTTTTIAACSTQPGPSLTISPRWYVFKATTFVGTGVNVGDIIDSPYFPANTTVTGIGTTTYLGYYYVIASTPATSDSARLPAGDNFDFVSRTGSADILWVSQVVPGADADESCDSLLRTYVSAVGTYGAGSASITITDGNDTYITPGMLVTDADFTAGTVVTAVNTTTHVVTVSPMSNSAAGSGGATIFAYDTGDTTLATGVGATSPGHVRTFGNAFPMVCPWNKTYLDQFEDDDQASTFSAASPGYAQDGVNTWMNRNRRPGPAHFGKLVGMADLGPYELQFYAKGRMRVYNPRTGLTRADEDYTKVVASWNRGARSPYAICSGNGWAIFLSDEGFFVCDGGEEERLISLDIYNAEMQEGTRGELEYAVKACIAASDSDSDDYKIHAQVHSGVMSVRYHSSADATYPDREIRYDFSSSVGRSGIAEVLRPDGSAYPWSTPLTLRHSCSARMAQADGDIWHYAAVDANAHATKDGRVDRIDTGTLDVTTPVAPVGYTGIYLPQDMNETQPTMAYVVSTKAGTGLDVSLSRTPEVEPQDAQWDALEVPSSGADSYGRSVRWLKPEARRRRSAIEVRISDDGTGSCPEISDVMIEASEVTSTTGDRRRAGV